MNRDYIHLLHILVSAPLMIYVGHDRGNGPNWLYQLVLAVGAIVLLYHAYLFFEKYMINFSCNNLHNLYNAEMIATNKLWCSIFSYNYIYILI